MHLDAVCYSPVHGKIIDFPPYLLGHAKKRPEVRSTQPRNIGKRSPGIARHESSNFPPENVLYAIIGSLYKAINISKTYADVRLKRSLEV